MLQASNLPSVIRGFLTTNGYVVRETVYANNTGDLADIGGNDIRISVPPGPYKVGLEYPISITIQSSAGGTWTRNNTTGTPQEILGLERSSIGTYFDQNKVNLTNSKVDYRGQTVTGVIVNRSVTLATMLLPGAGRRLCFKCLLRSFLKQWQKR